MGLETCCRCYRVSKTAALWLDVYRWITKGAEDWRSTLVDCRPPVLADELEKTVIRLVKFERCWSRGLSGATKTACFNHLHGFTSAFIPGGRWLLVSVRSGIRGVMSYDLEDVKIHGRMLISQEPPDQEILAMDAFSNDDFTGPTFDLAIQSITGGKIYIRTDMG